MKAEPNRLDSSSVFYALPPELVLLRRHGYRIDGMKPEDRELIRSWLQRRHIVLGAGPPL